MTEPGPLGATKNPPCIDGGTSALCPTRPPVTFGLIIGEIEILEIDEDKMYKKWEVGTEVYDELGLAGQIAKKLAPLPYRAGKILPKTGRLMKKGKTNKNKWVEGEGLVCTSFALVFGALWFEGKPEEQAALPMEYDPAYGEKKARSPAPVYAEKYGGSIVNPVRLKLSKLMPLLKRDKLYAVVKYKKNGKREHIFLLIHSKRRGDWVSIESAGKGRKTGGTGPGPGIYEVTKSSKSVYQAWDWGEADREVNPEIDLWEYAE